MTSVSVTKPLSTFPSVLDSLKASPSATHDAIVFAANWYHKEIQRAKTISQIGDEESQKSALALYATLMDWALSPISSRWHEPRVHEIFMESATKSYIQEFLLGRLQQLTLTTWFDDRETIKKFVTSSSITPDSNTVEALKDLNIQPVFEAMIPNWDYINVSLTQNYWLTMLFFCLKSFQLLGYDNEFLLQ